MKKITTLLFSFLLLIACGENKNNMTSTEDSTGKATQTASADTKSIAMNGEMPAEKSIPALFDELDYQQAVQCYLWALPIVSFANEMKTQQEIFGAKATDIVLYNSYEDKLGILTANATTPYILSFFNLAKTGPMVIEMPAGAIAGGVTDAWQREMVSMGEAGPDKGKGGKFLLLPPGSKLAKVAGYFNVPCTTMNLWFGIRALDPDWSKDEVLIKAVKIYPYAERTSPPQTHVLSPGGKKYNMGQPDGMEYWQLLRDILQDEPVEERDRFFIAWLDNLGLKKGQAFNPTAKQKAALKAGAEKGKLIAYANTFKKRFDDARHWPDRQWDYPMIMKDASQRVENFDEFFQRASYFFEAVGYSKSMISKTPGLGQAYLGTYSDKDGNWLDGAKSYSLHIPANPPAANFWSITIYDDATRCLIDNPQRKADLSSRQDLIKNADGSVDLYFGSTSPAGKEKNWVQTLPGKHWFMYMRFYGPTQTYFNKSWKMGDVEQTK